MVSCVLSVNALVRRILRKKSLACLAAMAVMTVIVACACLGRLRTHEDPDELLLKRLQDIGPWPLGDSTILVNDTIAKRVQRQARIFCWMTSRQTSRAKLLAVNSTWAQRCDRHVFVMTSAGLPLPPGAIDLGVPDGRSNLVLKTKRMITWLYENVVDEYDWFLKADDDTYVVMENLRFLLTHFDSKVPVYLGHPFKYGPGYNSGGAGYVLSRPTIKHLVLEAFPLEKECDASQQSEDMFIGQCLRAINVSTYETRDRFDRDTFLPANPRTNFMGPLPGGIEEYEWILTPVGPTCCSQLLITIHYMTPENMFLLEFALYRAAVYGRFAPPKLFNRFFNNDTLVKRRPYIQKTEQATDGSLKDAAVVPAPVVGRSP